MFLLLGHHYTFRDCVSWNRGLPVAFRWLLSISLSSLSFSLFPPEGLRTSSRTTFSAPLSPSGSLSYCSSHVLAILLLFFSLVDSRRRDSLASRHLSIVRTYPDEEAAHTSLPGTLVSSPGRVSGARLRARCRTQTRTHLSSSVLHPNVCQRPRNFVCVHIIYVTLCAQTRVLILLILLFPRHPRIFSFFSSYREIDQRVFPHIFRYLFFRCFFFNGARDVASSS